jgi:hypothetical protein
MRLASGVLRHGQKARHAAPLLVLAAHQIARALGRDEHHVEVLARGDLAEVHVEAVRKEQGGPFLQAGLDGLVEGLLRGVRQQHGHQVRPGDRCGRLGHGEAVLLRFFPAGAAPAHPDHHVEA